MNLQDIKIVGSEGWGSECIYILDEGGLLTDELYSWNCPDNGFEDWCWADSEGNVADLEVTEGMGFYIYSDYDELYVTFSGEVVVGEYSVNLRLGYNITGNFSPVDLDLQDIKIVGSEGWGSECIYILDEGGLLTDELYSWNCPDNGFEDWCWADGEGLVAEKTIKAGEGIYIYSDYDLLQLTLPAVIPAPAAE